MERACPLTSAARECGREGALTVTDLGENSVRDPNSDVLARELAESVVTQPDEMQTCLQVLKRQVMGLMMMMSDM